MSNDHFYKTPAIASSVFIAPGAQVIGDVTIGENSSIWYNVTLRGDIAAIKIGKNTNIQDGTVLHVDHDVPVVIGDNVSVGHNAIVHSATVEDNVLIGMGATVLSGAKVGKGAVVAAGALVKENFEVLPNTLVMGVPAKIRREITPEEAQDIQRNADSYATLRQMYLEKS